VVFYQPDRRFHCSGRSSPHGSCSLPVAAKGAVVGGAWRVEATTLRAGFRGFVRDEWFGGCQGDGQARQL